jgi:hypothetical protein
MSRRIRAQIAKDTELMQTPGSGVTASEWHFFQGKSGKGPTPELEKALTEAGIRIVVP